MPHSTGFQFNPRDPRGSWLGRHPGEGQKELDNFGIGARFWFPDDAGRQRVERYADAELLLDPTQHYKLFLRLGPGVDPPAEEGWLYVDFPGMLARLMRHYALGPGFGVAAKRQASSREVQRIFEAGEVAERLRQAAEAFPIFGDAVFRIDVEDGEDEEGNALPQAMPKFIHPGNYHPTFDPVDATRVLSVTLAWVFPKPEHERGGPMPFLVLKEIHEPGSVRYEVVEWDGKKEGGGRPVSTVDADLEDGPTGIDEIPVVHVAYNAAGGVPFGRSEFSRIVRIFLALENRLSQEDEILERHARPKLIVGPGVLDEQGRARLADFDVIEIDPSIMEKAVRPEYLTWDPQIQAIQHEIEKLEEYFFMTTETSPASFGLERDGSQVESARALRFKAHRTINKVEDLRDPLKTAVRKLFRIAQKLEIAAREEDGVAVYARTAVTVLFPDPVIEDDTQEAMDAALLKQAGLLSRKRGVMDLFNLSPDEADEEVREILQDMTDEQVAVPVQPPVEDTIEEEMEGEV